MTGAEYINKLKIEINNKLISGKTLSNNLISLSCLIKGYDYCYRKVIDGKTDYNEKLNLITNKINLIK